jgi:phosphoribosylaminoimidazole-succinocarboxamide synthase
MGLEEGTEIKETILEFCYKDDALGDPMINDYHVYAVGLADREQVEKIKEYTFKINEIMKEYFAARGIRLVDFKLEFGLYDGKVILADEISPDTCRLWDMETGKKLDKDRFRRDLGDVEATYQEVLNRIQG